MSAATFRHALLPIALAALAALATAFSGGDSGSGLAPPGSTPTEVDPASPPPGLHLEIVSIAGGTKKGGLFKVGSKLKVKFKLTKDDGTPWDVGDMDTARIMVSGPSFNYQRVIAELDDVAGKSKWKKKDGTWNYAFKQGLPQSFLPPLNDSDAFNTDDSELTGQPLLAGTYTVGMSVSWKYTVGGVTYQLADDATADFLFGGATDLVPREVVGKENCNLCHDALQAHDGRYRSPAVCVLCHTNGAEDRNDPAVAGGTPGVSAAFRVMIHRIHNGAHLPSVHGVGTNQDGTRNYALPPQPYLLVDSDDVVHDFSNVKFPVFPNARQAMPRDLGYSALTPSQKAQEDAILTGVTKCARCHGDPDGDGPLAAPAQGEVHEKQPGRNACGSCHDDVDFHKNYLSNGNNMLAEVGFVIACVECHDVAGQQLSVRDAHRHPLDNDTLTPAPVVNLTGISGGSGAGGRFLPGDSPALTFSLKDGEGADVPLSSCDAATVTLAGPSNGRQAVMPYPGAAAIAASPFDFGGRLASASPSGKGSMGKLLVGEPGKGGPGEPITETVTVEFTSATAFTVTGSVSGNLGSGDLPASPSTNPAGSAVSSFEVSEFAAPQDITITFSNATNFTVTGSLAGVLGTGALNGATNASTSFRTFDGTVAFILSVGPTPFAAGNKVFATVFRSFADDPVIFPIVAGRTSFSSAAPAPDRFYHDVIPVAPSYTLTVPMDMTLEYLGNGSGAAGQMLFAGNQPVDFGHQALWEVTAVGSATTLSAGAARFDRFIDVASTAGYAVGDTAVLDSGAGVGTREYAAVGWVESGTRMWLSTPLRYAHNAGATIGRATLSFRQEGAAHHYTLGDSKGAITSVVPFGSGNALVLSYRTAGRFGWRRHVGDPLQTRYVPPVNDSNALGEDWGDWSGKAYVDGTYTASLFLARDTDLGLFGEVQTYRRAANAADIDFLFGAGSGAIEPEEIIASAADCASCHDGLDYHGDGSASLTACLMCHQPGAEDLPPYAANGGPPATTGVTIDFRTLVHKIHRGAGLANAGTYEVVGAGPPPDGFSLFTYEHVVFPSMPGGVLACAKCHGAGNDAWKEPKDRTHPTDQLLPTRVWRAACSSCHDSDAATAHIDVQTSAAGVESCEVCHGENAELSVEKVHVVR